MMPDERSSLDHDVPSVLLVDDRPANLVALEAVLEPLGVRLVRATGADDALAAVKEREFAVILLDVQMPEVDGYEVSRRIKALEAPRLTPVIFLTALDEDRRHVSAGYESGAVDYLFKPLDPDVLRAKVRAFVSMYMERDAAERRARRRYADLAQKEAERASERRAAAILESITDAFYALDASFHFTYVNRRAEELWGRGRTELLGRNYVEEFPQVVGSESHEMHRQVMSRRQPARFETISPVLQRWISISIYPEASGGISCYFQDISERKEAETERERLLDAEHAARERAEEANAVKSQFLATMSHELRTPLNAQIGYAQLLEMGLAGPLNPEQQRYVQRLTSSSTHLLGLINDILDFSKIEAGEMLAHQEDAFTGPVVRDAMELVRPLARERGVELVHDRSDDDGVPFVGDEQRLRQILVNLLSNAAKFTESGGRVSVTCGLEQSAPPNVQVHGAGPWAYLQVADTGIGIAPEQLAHIFDPFHQVDSTHTRAQGGTGLGLAISRRLARLMGGDLVAESALQAGSTFTVWLPSARMEPSEIWTAASDDSGKEVREPGAPQREPAIARAARATPSASAIARPDLGEISQVVRDLLDEILDAYVDRLRNDPATPRARRMRRPEIEDHTLTLVSDIAQTLLIVGKAGRDAPKLLRDGSEIQHAIAEHHGRRRREQGWTETAVHRDHQLLREEIERAVRARLRGRSGDTGLEEGIQLLLQLVHSAEGVSANAWRHAGEEPDGPGSPPATAS
ncbi:MAG TPA: ATP-binding protein [Gemmatimonadaceae bacterium]|nr:ATP-binding protein [Gemmatimonadaceae bacterium]